MWVIGLLPAREMYRDIDWPVLVLLGGMMAVGQALQETGTTDMIANAIVQVAGDLSPLWILTLGDGGHHGVVERGE